MRQLFATAALIVSGCTAPAPTIALLEPLDGDTVCGTPLIIDVTVDNFTLVDWTHEERIRGEGHVDFKLNGQNRWMTYDPPTEIPEQEDGAYLLEAFLVNADHYATEPYVGDEALITVDNSLCGS